MSSQIDLVTLQQVCGGESKIKAQVPMVLQKDPGIASNLAKLACAETALDNGGLAIGKQTSIRDGFRALLHKDTRAPLVNAIGSASSDAVAQLQACLR